MEVSLVESPFDILSVDLAFSSLWLPTRVVATTKFQTPKLKWQDSDVPTLLLGRVMESSLAKSPIRVTIVGYQADQSKQTLKQSVVNAAGLTSGQVLCSGKFCISRR